MCEKGLIKSPSPGSQPGTSEELRRNEIESKRKKSKIESDYLKTRLRSDVPFRMRIRQRNDAIQRGRTARETESQGRKVGNIFKFQEERFFM